MTNGLDRRAEIAESVAEDREADPIHKLLADVQGKLAQVKEQESQTIKGLEQAIGQVLMTKRMAELRGERRDVQVSGETVLNVLRNHAITATLLAGAIEVLCTIVGSIMVQVEPGEVETLDGQTVIPGVLTACGEKRPGTIAQCIHLRGHGGPHSWEPQEPDRKPLPEMAVTDGADDDD